jgi:hypothetical protein
MKTRPWVTVQELNHPHDPNALDATLAASSVLFALSGEKYGGEQQVTERYTCETGDSLAGCSYDERMRGWWNPTIGMFTYVPTPGPAPARAGGYIRLRSRPVRSVLSVSIGGVLQDPSSYELLDGSTIALRGGWGLCSTPEITYTFGVDPPPLGRMAARRLANELLAAARGDECKLPTNVTSVSRQGLSFEIWDPQAFLDKGHTGLYEVDLFVATVNPGKAKKRPRVFSPDLPRARRRS